MRCQSDLVTHRRLRRGTKILAVCTVSIVPNGDGFRLMCNRDEQRQRATALPPTLHTLPTGVALYPIDPVGGGTWVGVNDAGLAAALLNRTISTAGASPKPELRSRGLIVPELLRCRSLRDAVDLAASIDVSTFNPFRLVVVQPTAATVIASDGASLTTRSLDTSKPCMLTSSSLGDERVEQPRMNLFERLVVRRKRDTLAGQARFHEHRWPSRGAVSVTMERSDARTVSRTVISVTSRGVELQYDPFDSNPPRMFQLR